MNGDDGRSEPEWPIRPSGGTVNDRSDEAPLRRQSVGREEDTTIVRPRRRSFAPIALALGAIVLLLIAGFVFSGLRNSENDKLTGSEQAAASKNADPEKVCASTQTYDLIKRELFRSAAQVRGTDQPVFDRLSSYAVLRMDNPVMESNDDSSRRVDCSGSLSIDLPPGVAVSGGHTSLSSDVDYSVQPAADGSGNVVVLRNADRLISSLATLARTGQAEAQTPVSPEESTTAREQDESTPAPPAAAPEPRPAPAPAAPPPPVARAAPSAPSRAPAPSAGPAFDCSRATNPNEREVCSDPGLAALDRQMSAQYRGALAAADPDERTLLVQTGRRFIAYRNRCSSTACIVDAYHGRMQEVRDITSGHWHP